MNAQLIVFDNGDIEVRVIDPEPGKGISFERSNEINLLTVVVGRKLSANDLSYYRGYADRSGSYKTIPGKVVKSINSLNQIDLDPIFS